MRPQVVVLRLKLIMKCNFHISFQKPTNDISAEHETFKSTNSSLTNYNFISMTSWLTHEFVSTLD